MPSISQVQSKELEAGLHADAPLVPQTSVNNRSLLPKRIVGLAALASAGSALALLGSRALSSGGDSADVDREHMIGLQQVLLGDGSTTAEPPASGPCMALEFSAEVDGRVKSVSIPSGEDGDRHAEKCAFDDGSSFARGEVIFECSTGQWKHIASTCTNSKCLPGSVSIDFFGGIGEIHYSLDSKEERVDMQCPPDAPNPAGHITFECGGSQQTGEWKYIGQDCQVCDPTSLNIHFDGHSKQAELPSGGPNHIAHSTCDFDDGKSYNRGSIIYKCFAEGWKFWRNTCRDWVCPSSKASVSITYEKSGELVGGHDTVEIPGGNVGEHSVHCPPNSPDPNGKITFSCSEDGSWKALSGDCGGGKMVTPANFLDQVGKEEQTTTKKMGGKDNVQNDGSEKEDGEKGDEKDAKE